MSNFLALLSTIIFIVHCEAQISLPCDKKQPNVFCMGAKGFDTSMAGEGCVVAKDCQILIVGIRNETLNTVLWQLMTDVPVDPTATLLMRFFLIKQPYEISSGVSVGFLPPKVLVNGAICYTADFCKSCAQANGLTDELEVCSNEPDLQQNRRADQVTLTADGNVYRRLVFTWPQLLFRSPYRVDTTADKVYPYAYTFDRNNVLHTLASVKNPIVLFSPSQTPGNPTTATDAPIDDIVTVPANSTGDQKNLPGNSSLKTNKYIIIGAVIVGIVLLLILGICYFRSQPGKTINKSKRRTTIVDSNAEGDPSEVVTQASDVPSSDVPVTNISKRRVSNPSDVATQALTSYAPSNVSKVQVDNIDQPSSCGPTDSTKTIRASPTSTATTANNLPSYVPSTSK